MSGVPEEMVPDGDRVVSDQTSCTRCGEETRGGYFDDDGDFYCRFCHTERDPDTVHVVGGSAVCECGYETDTKTTGVFGNDPDWVCPRCMEMFPGRECDDCGREACTNAVFGRSGEYCIRCIRGGGE